MNYGQDLRAARDQKLQLELQQKAVARRYQQWAISAGLSPQDAHRYASPDVQAGLVHIRRDEKKHQLRVAHQTKERIAARFSVAQSPRA